MSIHDSDVEIKSNLRRSKRFSNLDEVPHVSPKKVKKNKQIEKDVNHNESISAISNSEKSNDLNNSTSSNFSSCETCGNKFVKKFDKKGEVKSYKCSPCKKTVKEMSIDYLEDNNKICENCKDNSISAENKMIGCLICMKYLHVNCLLKSDLPPDLKFDEGQLLRRKLRCIRCAVIHLCYKVDIIITWRWRNEALTVGNPEKYYMSREFLIHYANMSYWDCEWISEVQLEISEMNLYRSYKKKCPNFTIPPTLKTLSDCHKRKLSPTELVLYEKYFQWGIDLEWLQPQKVLKMDDVGCFVKWRNLGYEFVSTEPLTRVKEIDGLQEAIDRHIRLIDELVGTSWVYKDKTTLTKLSESPGYLGSTVTTDNDRPSLHPYQLEGVNWLRSCFSNNINTILADEMGLGKTIQAIALLYSLYKDKVSRGPFLIAVPLSTIKNWEREFEFWAPDLCVVSYYGDRDARATIRDKDMYYENKRNVVTFHVLLTTYELVFMDDSFLIPIKWEILIVDEAHRLKNNEAKLFKSLKKYKINWRLLMTGTPLQNNLEELFHLLNFMEPSSFGDMAGFLSRFADVSKEEQVRTLQDMLKKHILRRLKSDVFVDLPNKQEQIVRVELTPFQKSLYKMILTRNYAVLSGPRFNGIKLTNIMMQLRKCCNHPYLLSRDIANENMLENGQYDGAALIAASGKMAILHTMLTRLRETGHKVLLFSGMTRLLDLIECVLEHMGIQFERIDGSVSSVSRQNAIDRFNDPESVSMVFLLSTKAGGLGINLSSADTVFIYDADWNPQNDIQALSRAHRIGQTKKVMIYRFVTRNSVEEKIMETAKRKMMVTNLVVKSFTKSEFHQIISFGTKELFDENNEQNQKTIVYDDAAIDQLLDRTQTEPVNPDTSLVDSCFSGFKLAQYQYASDTVPSTGSEVVTAVTAIEENGEQENDPDNKQADVQVVDNCTDPESVNPAEYWTSLLESVMRQDQIQEIDEKAQPPAAEFGKGLRKRKKVDYGIKLSQNSDGTNQVAESETRDKDPDDTDYDISEGESPENADSSIDQSRDLGDKSDYEYEIDDADNGADDDDDDDYDNGDDDEDDNGDDVHVNSDDEVYRKPGGHGKPTKTRIRYNYDRDLRKLTKFGLPKGGMGLDSSNEYTPPVVRYEHFSVVAGFMPRERMEVYEALMNYGLPSRTLRKGDIWWPPALDHKTVDEMDRFVGTFMAALYDCYHVSPARTNSDILRDEIDYDLLLTRIGINGLISYKVNQFESPNRTILEIVTYKSWNIRTISLDDLSCLFDDLRYFDFDFNIFDGGFSSIHRLWLDYRSATSAPVSSSPSEPKPNPTLKWNKLHDYYLLSAIASHGYDRFIDVIFHDPQYQILFIPARLNNLDLIKDNAEIRKSIRERQKVLENGLVLEAQLIKVGSTLDGYTIDGISPERLTYYNDLFASQGDNHFVTPAFANTRQKLAAVTQLELLINDVESTTDSFQPILMSYPSNPA